MDHRARLDVPVAGDLSAVPRRLGCSRGVGATALDDPAPAPVAITGRGGRNTSGHGDRDSEEKGGTTAHGRGSEWGILSFFRELYTGGGRWTGGRPGCQRGELPFHRALFAVSCDQLRAEIQLLTGRKVKESAVVVEPATGAIVHAFTSGTIVQIFQLEPRAPITPPA
jgi:hypothetical protein